MIPYLLPNFEKRGFFWSKYSASSSKSSREGRFVSKKLMKEREKKRGRDDE